MTEDPKAKMVEIKEPLEDLDESDKKKLEEIYNAICSGNPSVSSRVTVVEDTVKEHTKLITAVKNDISWIRKSLSSLQNKNQSQDRKIWAILIGILGILGSLLISLLTGVI